MSYSIHTGISNLTGSLLLLNKIGLLEYMHRTGSLKQKNRVKGLSIVLQYTEYYTCTTYIYVTIRLLGYHNLFYLDIKLAQLKS